MLYLPQFNGCFYPIRPTFNLAKAIKDQLEKGDLLDFKTPLKPLLHFEGDHSNQSQTGILYTFGDYLELVDWTGRTIRNDLNLMS